MTDFLKLLNSYQVGWTTFIQAEEDDFFMTASNGNVDFSKQPLKGIIQKAYSFPLDGYAQILADLLNANKPGGMSTGWMVESYGGKMYLKFMESHKEDAAIKVYPICLNDAPLDNFIKDGRIVSNQYYDMLEDRINYEIYKRSRILAKTDGPRYAMRNAQGRAVTTYLEQSKNEILMAMINQLSKKIEDYRKTYDKEIIETSERLVRETDPAKRREYQVKLNQHISSKNISIRDCADEIMNLVRYTDSYSLNSTRDLVNEAFESSVRYDKLDSELDQKIVSFKQQLEDLENKTELTATVYDYTESVLSVVDAINEQQK